MNVEGAFISIVDDTRQVRCCYFCYCYYCERLVFDVSLINEYLSRWRIWTSNFWTAGRPNALCWS